MQIGTFSRDWITALLVVLASSCAGQAGARRETAAPETRTVPEAARSPAARAARMPERGTAADVDAELAREARLETVESLALARSPELAEAQGRARAARELAPAAARLPDTELEYQLWAQPLSSPLALDEAQMHMFGVRQAFPAPGSLGARSRAAAEQAGVLSEAGRAREQDLRARVRRAYAEYYRADREYRIRLEHVALSEQVLELARAVYQGGRGTQQDVLRAAVELSKLHNDLATTDADRRSARALLNTLMVRPIDAALGPPAALETPDLDVELERVEQWVTAKRPEIVAAEKAIRARQSELEAARATARWPSFMVGLQYMYMPPGDEPHNYGVTLSMSLPWLNPRSREEVRAAEASVASEQSALSSARIAARFELYDAALRLRSARESLAVIERDLLPQARQSFDVAQALYRGGQGDSLALFDALRSLLDVRLERERALARFQSALAGLERAAGGPIPVTANPRKSP